MSEQKAFDVGLGQYCEDGSPCVVAFDADRNPRLLNEKVYLKSEADKVIAELKKENAELKEAKRWRKCSEELPEEAGDYLVANYNGTRVSIATFVIRPDRRYFGGIPFGLIESGVGYWMPLPSAPKEGE